MRQPLTVFVFFLLCVLSIEMSAQCGAAGVYCMQTGVEYSCAGTFLDAGGDDIYPEEAMSYTLCPDLDGYRTSITFTSFDLDNSVWPSAPDELRIYDGTNINAAVIGTYTGSELNGITVSATNGNASGCLLIQFIIGGGVNDSHSGWSADITCIQPCIPPQPVASVADAFFDSGIFLKCLGDELTFSAEGSTAAPGHTITSYTWDYIDGTTATTSELTALHTYSNDAIYDVRLVALDDIGCAGDVVIHAGVMGAPDFDLPVDFDACIGAEVVLNATYTAPTIDNNVLLLNNDTLFMPDGAGFSYQSEILISGYGGGGMLNSCEDLAGIYANMEHSYLGDLSIQVICPNGTSVTLLEYPNGGGGKYLGEAIDDDGSEFGLGYEYWWSPTAGNGTMSEEAASTFALESILPSDTYSSHEDLCAFVGCPINGTWTFVVTDNQAIDNGYVFSWGIGLAPSTDTEILEYTAVIDPGLTTSFWSGSGIAALSENGDDATLNTTTAGSLDLQYTTIDNIGCTFTQNYAVDVIDNPLSLELEDYFVYGEPNTYLLANYTGFAPDILEWSWTPGDGLAAPNSQITEVLLPNDNEAYTVLLTSPTLAGCSATATVGMNLPELVVSGYIFYDMNENGGFDAGEPPIANFPYMSTTGITAFSDADGFYSAYCIYGSNTITLQADPTLWTLTTPYSFTTLLDDDVTESINNNFGIVPNSTPQTILNGEISNSSTWCLIDNAQIISVSNDGNTQPSGYVIYTHDPLCTVISSDPAPYLVDANNLYFSFEDIPFAGTAVFTVNLDMPDTAEGGDLLNFNLQTFYTNGTEEELVETEPLAAPLMCSYDPNDKREMNGTGDEGFVAPNTTLDYVIRFQNTGTAAAMDVVITDQLPFYVFPSTLDPVVASHPFTASVTPEGLITFVFDNIMLPDSGSSFAESIGFIHFRIDQIPDLASGTVINNKARIYFDANSPIVTNETVTTIFQCESSDMNIVVDGGEIQILDIVNNISWLFNGNPLPDIGSTIIANEAGVYTATGAFENGCLAYGSVVVDGVDEALRNRYQLYPNPATDMVSLQLGNSGSDVSVSNGLGQLMMRFNNVSGLQELDCRSLPAGSYMVNIKDTTGTSTMKLMVK